jgi:hypothetical protein
MKIFKIERLETHGKPRVLPSISICTRRFQASSITNSSRSSSSDNIFSEPSAFYSFNTLNSDFKYVLPMFNFSNFNTFARSFQSVFSFRVTSSNKISVLCGIVFDYIALHYVLESKIHQEMVRSKRPWRLPTFVVAIMNSVSAFVRSDQKYFGVLTGFVELAETDSLTERLSIIINDLDNLINNKGWDGAMSSTNITPTIRDINSYAPVFELSNSMRLILFTRILVQLQVWQSVLTTTPGSAGEAEIIEKMFLEIFVTDTTNSDYLVISHKFEWMNSTHIGIYRFRNYAQDVFLVNKNSVECISSNLLNTFSCFFRLFGGQFSSRFSNSLVWLNTPTNPLAGDIYLDTSLVDNSMCYDFLLSIKSAPKAISASISGGEQVNKSEFKTANLREPSAVGVRKYSTLNKSSAIDQKYVVISSYTQGNVEYDFVVPASLCAKPGQYYSLKPIALL